MVPEELKGTLTEDPEVMSGLMCFCGTRIPVSILLDNLHDGVTLEEFREGYPDVSDDQIQAVRDYQDKLIRLNLGLDKAS